jgi:hypothetical protein
MNCYSGSGASELLVLKNAPVPDRPGRFICSLPDEAGASDFGIAFRAPTKLDCGDILEVAAHGIFRLAFGGTLETVAMVGEPALALHVGGAVSYQRLSGVPRIEASGLVAFEARITGAVTEDIVYSCGPATACPGGQALPVVYEGQLDGSGAAVTLSRFESVDIANGGDRAFQTLVNQPGFPTGKNRGIGIYIYREASGTLERVAVKGDDAPDTLPAEFRKIYLPDLSPNGRLAFRGKVKRAGGPGALGVYIYE